MKKFLIFLFLICFVSVSAAFAEDSPAQSESKQETENVVLQGEAVFNWLDMSQIERDTIIQNYKNIIFGQDTVYKYKRKEFKSMYKDFVKDSDFQYHYMEAKNGITETPQYRLSAFFSEKY